jgi:hypothetical protein
VAEYYRRTEKKDKLISLDDRGVVRMSDLPPDMRQEILADPNVKTRDIIE